MRHCEIRPTACIFPVPMVLFFEAYRELIEGVASDAYDAEGPFNDHGRILVTSEALPRVIRVQASHCLNPWTSLSKASRYSLQNWITVTSLSSTLNAYDLFPITGSGVPGSAKK